MKDDKLIRYFWDNRWEDLVMIVRKPQTEEEAEYVKKHFGITVFFHKWAYCYHGYDKEERIVFSAQYATMLELTGGDKKRLERLECLE